MKKIMFLFIVALFVSSLLIVDTDIAEAKDAIDIEQAERVSFRSKVNSENGFIGSVAKWKWLVYNQISSIKESLQEQIERYREPNHAKVNRYADPKNQLVNRYREPNHAKAQ
ncbi:hypothetical protein JXB12_10125 [candidate division KSB1 bacterium]|nr:hypothetical protein [candidate division KSB1 bacterium]